MASHQKYNILYGRLSQEDARMGDSNSIVNQRRFLEKFAQDNGFENTLFLADDGYSGTNFERPSWKKVIEMIEADEVESLIVKDLSRLGREYLQVGYYTEIYLPQKGIRFIAVNDAVDSLVESSSDFNPIRNWANESELIQIVLDDLRRVTHFARMKERQFAAYINQKNSAELRREINALRKELDSMKRRDKELSALFKRIYEDHVLERVTSEQFRMLSADYNAEQKAIQDAIPEKEVRLEKLRDSAANVDAFIEIILFFISS